MSRLAPLFRFVMTALALVAWGASSVGVVYAEAERAVAAADTAPHIEATGEWPGHDSHEGDDCGFCRLLSTQQAASMTTPALGILTAAPEAPRAAVVPMTGVARVAETARGPPSLRA